MKKSELVLILVDIRSVYNVGSILRTADGLGVKEVYLVGTTPTPVDRFGRKRGDIEKTALGAEVFVQWKYASKTEDVMPVLKASGYDLVAVELTAESQDIYSFDFSEKTALVLGNEVEGLSFDVLEGCTAFCEIPMRGSKESLNVSIAAAISMFKYNISLY